MKLEATHSWVVFIVDGRNAMAAIKTADGKVWKI
jgi:hypothetical protein